MELVTKLWNMQVYGSIFKVATFEHFHVQNIKVFLRRKNYKIIGTDHIVIRTQTYVYMYMHTHIYAYTSGS